MNIIHWKLWLILTFMIHDNGQLFIHDLDQTH